MIIMLKEPVNLSYHTGWWLSAQAGTLAVDLSSSNGAAVTGGLEDNAQLPLQCNTCAA
jgi:hypothetical protein